MFEKFLLVVESVVAAASAAGLRAAAIKLRRLSLCFVLCRPAVQRNAPTNAPLRFFGCKVMTSSRNAAL